MEIKPKLADLTPYLGALLLKATDPQKTIDAAFAKEMAKTIKEAIKAAGATIEQPFPVEKAGDALWVGAFVYRRTETPSWWKAGPDEAHLELVVVAAKGPLVAISASEGSLRDALFKAPGKAAPLSRSTMHMAFIGPRATTAWLNGIHAPTAVKADAKMLSGTALEHAIDPLGDQSYYLSALRSWPDIAGLTRSKPVAQATLAKPKPAAAATAEPIAEAAKPKAVAARAGAAKTKKTPPERYETANVGVAPGRSRVWLGRPQSWDLFVKAIEALLDHLASDPKGKSYEAYSRLAQEVGADAALGKAYATAILPRELLNEDAEAAPQVLEQARRLAYDTEFLITPAAKGGFTTQVRFDALDLGRLQVELEPGAAGKVRLKPTWLPDDDAAKEDRDGAAGAEHDAVQDEEATTPWAEDPVAEAALYTHQALKARITALVTDEATFKVYYDSNHTLADGRIYSAGYSDHPFPWTFEPFEKWNIHREKPVVTGLKLVDALLSGRDTSLFDYVRDTYAADGFLLCDDGSMELADFIHLGRDDVLRLIHVKSAGGKKRKRTDGLQLSVSDFEVVTAQAIKNLRHLDPTLLAERLKTRNRRAVSRATWIDGVPQDERLKTDPKAKTTDREAFLKALAARKPFADTIVMIVQPRLTNAEAKICAGKTDDRGLRLKQLNGLMLAADLSCKARGARLVALADKTVEDEEPAVS